MNGKNVAFLGYGRFGRALGGLLLEAGFSVRASDPYADVPSRIEKPLGRELVEGADFVIVAVPVPQMARAFASLKPFLTKDQIVVDVGSVKLKPIEAMSIVFGREIPWVGTHPLFGPASLARAERPLRTVVCPNPLHPAAVASVSALFRRIGCEVFMQDPDTHDRRMAESHSLAFFVAKGMLEAGVDMDNPFAPPSFQAIARTVEAVRSDAGHLFTVLHRDNPYASGSRKRFLNALSLADEQLLAKRDTIEDEPSTGALNILDLGKQSLELQETRDLIDELDADLLRLLARRAELGRRAARAKAELGHGVRDAAREASLLETRRKSAIELGLDPIAVDEVFQAILRFSRSHQVAPETLSAPMLNEDTRTR